MTTATEWCTTHMTELVEEAVPRPIDDTCSTGHIQWVRNTSWGIEIIGVTSLDLGERVTVIDTTRGYTLCADPATTNHIMFLYTTHKAAQGECDGTSATIIGSIYTRNVFQR